MFIYSRNIGFLEESFAALIGIIFIYEAFDKMIEINRHRPVRLHTTKILPTNCSCIGSNGTSYGRSYMTINVIKKNFFFSFILIHGFKCRIVLKTNLINLLVHNVRISMVKLIFQMYSSFQLFSLHQHLYWHIH